MTLDPAGRVKLFMGEGPHARFAQMRLKPGPDGGSSTDLEAEGKDFGDADFGFVGQWLLGAAL